MGITGLLPLLKSVQTPVHLSELSGKVIAVDAYVWLHRGVCCCATELATGKPTTKYVDYAMQRVRLLQHYNITPYLVFDGGPLPAKKSTELRRKRKRKESLEMANSLAKQGRHSLAREHYLKAVDVTPQMAFQFIKALRAQGILYVVAPYEADAQLFYLESIGLVDGILTEDSDLLVFGGKSVYFKLDTTSSSCILIQSNTLASNSNPDFPLYGWGLKELRECAMLNGCDYLEGIPGVGLKTASRYLRKWRTVEKTLRALRMEGKVFERDWEEKMRVAEVGFLHQRVWDPLQNEIVYLTEPDPETWNADREYFVGKYIEVSLASKIASGDVDPITLKPTIDVLPLHQPCFKDNPPRPLTSLDYNRPRNGNVTSQNSILNYFQKQRNGSTKQSSIQSVSSSTGKTSGKRTLVEEYDHAVSAKRCKSTESVNHNRHSKFFGNNPSCSTSRIKTIDDNDKENLEELDVSKDTEDPTVLDNGILNEDFNQPNDIYLTPTFITPTRNRKREEDHALDISSPLQRIVVSPCSSPARPNLRCTQTAADDIFEDHGHSPNSSDGRITSPPSISKNVIRTEAREMGVKSNQLDDVFVVDLKDTLFEEDTVTDWTGSPARHIEEDDIAHDEIDDDFQRRQRLVAEGWEKRFSRDVYTHNPHPCAAEASLKSGVEPKSLKGFSTFPGRYRKRKATRDPIQRFQMYRCSLYNKE